MSHNQPRDTGDLLEVPEPERIGVDPDPADVGEENVDAYTAAYDIPLGEDVDLSDEEEPS